MGIGAIKTTTATAYSELFKDPPWSPQDLDKLRRLMDQGATVADMARQLGTAVTYVKEKMEALAHSSPDANTAASSSAPKTTNPSTGKNVDIKV